MSLDEIKLSIRNVSDFPKQGIQFKDITTALKQPDVFKEIINLFYEEYKSKEINYVVGIESRGFIFGSVLAYLLDCGFVPIRKKGKLPSEVFYQEYDLEYGKDIIEIHKDALNRNDNVLIIDDLLATGGTALATSELIKQTGAKIIGWAFVIELVDLLGKSELEKIAPVFSLVKY